LRNAGKNLLSEEFPVNVSYIDTCLKGGVEVGGIDEVKQFIQTIKYWPDVFKLDDRSKSNYLRAAAAWLTP